MHDASAGDAESGSGSADTAPAEEPESPFARRAKLIALLLAATAVVVSMVVAAMQASDPAEPTGEGQSADRAGITGAAALGGFSLPASSDRTDRDTSADAASPAAAREGDETAMSQTETVADVAPPAGVEALDDLPEPGDEPHGTAATTTEAGVSRTDAEASSSTPVDPVDPRSVVRDFYDLVSSAPETALAKVSPTLVGDEREQLLRVWRSLTSVEVEHVYPETAGSVRVVVTMKPEYGPSLRITQLLGFSDGPHPVINRATLLSIKTM
ncbi:hypothetical protein [Saccharomonospora cyanea]|nr:hypothetical protein [Saccharomonospora cyanea]